MNIRKLKSNEITEYLNLLEGNEQSYTKYLFSRKLAKPDTTFVYIFDNKIEYGITFAQNFNSKNEFLIAGLPTNVRQQNKVDFQIFFDSSLKLLKQNYEVNSLEYRYENENIKTIEAVKRLFSKTILNHFQTKIYYKINKNIHQNKILHNIKFVPLKSIGKKTFIEVFQKVSKHIKDKENQWIISKMGERGAALEFFEDLKNTDYNPDIWCLAYNEFNDVVGLIIPQKFSSKTGSISYIGIVPEFRRKKYSYDLISFAINSLQDFEEIIAETDEENTAMQKGFEGFGFVKHHYISYFRAYL